MATNSLMKKMLANSPTKNVSIMSESIFFNEKDIVSTEYPIINIAFSGESTGGISSGLTLLAGPSGTFKSLTSLICAKAYLDKYEDSICVLLDSEGGMTPSYLKAQGIDPSRVLHVPIEHLEMLKFELVKQLKEIERGDKVIFVIDSIGNTGSLAEIQNALDEKSTVDLQRAKVIKGLFRMVTPYLISKDVPCIAICHTYETMEHFSRQIISGGSGLRYSANSAFIFSKSQEKSTDGDLQGWKFTITVDKSRFVREKSKLAFHVMFEGGIQKYSGLMDLALEAQKIVKPKNGWYSRVDDDGVVEDKKWRMKDTGCAEFWDVLLKSKSFIDWIAVRYKLGAGDIMLGDEPSSSDQIEDPLEE
jgi:RecA/RadA recombinase